MLSPCCVTQACSDSASFTGEVCARVLEGQSMEINGAILEDDFLVRELKFN